MIPALKYSKFSECEENSSVEESDEYPFKIDVEKHLTGSYIKLDENGNLPIAFF